MLAVTPPETAVYFVMLTEANREKIAGDNLRRRGIPFYLPTIFRAGRLSHAKHAAGFPRPDVESPLFPRALFIAEDVVRRSFNLIASSPGIASRPFMKFGEEPARLRSLGIAAVRRIESEERLAYFNRRQSAIAFQSWRPDVGDEVSVVLDKALGELRGKVSSVDKRGRITLLTKLMMRTVQVTVTLEQIKPA
jgi:transcription antitermination factor NusG